MSEYLMDNGAQLDMEDNDGWNSLDLAIIKMNYDVAVLLKRRGMVPRDKEMYIKNLWQEYDLDLFLTSLEEDREKVEYDRFFELPKRQREEWLNKDLVVDIRETWKTWAWR